MPAYESTPMKALFIASSLTLGAALARLAAQEPGDEPLLAHIRDRAPQLASIFFQGKAGEGLEGFVLPLPPGKARAALSDEDRVTIDAENADRFALFTAVGQGADAAPAQIAEIRAKQIRGLLNTAPGVWYQVPDGTQPEGYRWAGGLEVGYVWTKPGAALFSSPSATSGRVDDNVPSFSSYAISEAKDATDGKWYHVGTRPPGAAASKIRDLGWIPEKDVLPQPHRMVLSFRNDADRDKLLVFRRKQDALAIAGLAAPARAAECDRLLLEARRFTQEGTALPPDFPLLAIEPEATPEILRQLYVMPVLKADSTIKDLATGKTKDLMIDDVPSRIVQLASATAASDSQKDDGRRDLDVVFVIDATGTMQPFIDKVVDMCREMTASLQDGKTNYRFGCWGYQDSEQKKGIQYLTKNFTPQLLPVGEFAKTLGQVKANQRTDDEYPEAVLDGLTDAIQKTSWNPTAGRLIVLIGDAPPLPRSFRSGHDSRENLDRAGVRHLADSQRVSIVSINIQDPTFKNYHDSATTEFTALAVNRGASEAPALFSIAGGDAETFAQKSSSVIKGVIALFKRSNGEATPPPIMEAADRNKAQLLVNGLVRDLTSRAQNQPAPAFQTGWALSAGLKTKKPIFDVCVLVTRAELESCVALLEKLVEPGRRGNLSSKEHYTKMQKHASVIFFPDRNGAASQLPYRSAILQTSYEVLKDMGPDEIKRFYDVADAHVNLMRAKLQEDCWKPTHQNAQPDQYVTPFPLDQIP